MSGTNDLTLRPVGVVRSPLRSREEAPKQGREGAPAATIEIDAAFAPAVRGLAAGDEVLVLTWLDRGDRGTLEVHPRGNPANPLAGVFATRSPDRPNPIGLHRVRVVAIEGGRRLTVEPLEAIDGTPVLDLKPVLPDKPER